MTGNRIFGPRPWGPAVDEPELMTATPVGLLCKRCEEPIAEGDSGIFMPHSDGFGASIFVNHRECFIRVLVGSVGHQSERCSCFGGDEEDPPGMTKRQAARAACQRAGVML